MSKPKITETDISKLTPDPNNARKRTPLSASVIRKSLEQFGAARSIVVDENDVIRAGNGTFEEAGQLGIEKVLTVEVDGNTIVAVKRKGLTEEQWKQYAIADNTASDFSTWDFDILSELTQEVDLSEFFPDDKLNELLEQLGKGESFGVTEQGEENEEEIAELLDKVDEIESRVKLGEIWQLGRHKICCGDSTIEKNVRALLGDIKIDCMVTDPPYGVDYSAKNEFLNKLDGGDRNETPIKNDAIEDYELFFSQFLKHIPFSDYNTCYIFMSDRVLHELRIAFEQTGFTAACPSYLVWLKNNHVLGRSDYSAKHELILYGWKGKHKFYGDFSTTVLEFDKPQSSKEHPTMKPIELIERLYNDGSNSDANIYEPFLGSGTSIIAAQKLEGDRTVYGFELSPQYCTIILERFSRFTGQDPKLIGHL